jgi:hypothetical protein
MAEDGKSADDSQVAFSFRDCIDISGKSRPRLEYTLRLELLGLRYQP